MHIKNQMNTGTESTASASVNFSSTLMLNDSKKSKEPPKFPLVYKSALKTRTSRYSSLTKLNGAAVAAAALTTINSNESANYEEAENKRTLQASVSLNNLLDEPDQFAYESNKLQKNHQQHQPIVSSNSNLAVILEEDKQKQAQRGNRTQQAIAAYRYRSQSLHIQQNQQHQFKPHFNYQSANTKTIIKSIEIRIPSLTSSNGKQVAASKAKNDAKNWAGGSIVIGRAASKQRMAQLAKNLHQFERDELSTRQADSMKQKIPDDFNSTVRVKELRSFFESVSS